MTFAQNSEMTGDRSQDIPVLMPSSPWQTQVYAALRATRITQLAYVPDAGHAQLIEAAHADPDMRARDMEEVQALRERLRREHLFAVIRIAPRELPRHLPPRDGAKLSHRFRRALEIDDS
jgi:hypothetical protein